MLTLINSGRSSPFGRKVRVVLHELGLAFRDDVRPGLRDVAELREINPNLSLPVLVDRAMVLFDSNVIIEYLLDRHGGKVRQHDATPLARTLTRESRRWEDLRLLATIETFANTVVNIRHFRSEGRTSDVSRYMARQEARLACCLDWLEVQSTDAGFWPGCFSVMDIALVSSLAYAESRGVYSWRGHPKLETLFESACRRPSFVASSEREPASSL